MTTVFDVARCMLEKRGPMSAMKLQKLCYYAQAWSLVWDAEPLFPERIEAWVNGPVIPDLYSAHRGSFKVSAEMMISGDSTKLTAAQVETVDAVLKGYGDMTAQQLSDLTHSEDPWKSARQGLAPNDRGSVEITTAALEEFYSSIPA
ncbi:MAG: DUF4065 domain-containing protein [Planctomycetes bacterium]|nr:DUF4065 domain-containing protein [Planctomycetota bacterium]